MSRFNATWCGLLFLILVIGTACAQKTYKLVEVKPGPVRFEGEYDQAATIKLLFELAGVEYEHQQLAGKAVKKAINETPFKQLPVLIINDPEEGKTTLHVLGAEKYLAKEFGFMPEPGSIGETAYEIVTDLLFDWSFGDSLENGHNRWMFASNFFGESVYPAFRWLEYELNAAGYNYFGGNSLTVADIKIAAFVREVELAGPLIKNSARVLSVFDEIQKISVEKQKLQEEDATEVEPQQ